MTSERILDNLGNVSEEYIIEAIPGSRKETPRLSRKWIAAFACAVMIVVPILIYGVWRLVDGSDRIQIVTLENGDIITFVRSSTGEAYMAELNAVTRQLTADEISRLFKTLPVTAFGHFDTEDHRLFGFEGRVGGIKIIVSAADRPLRDTVVEGVEQISSVEGIPILAGYFITKPNSKGMRTAIYYAEFTVGGSVIYVENAGEQHREEAVRNELVTVVRQLIENGELDLYRIAYENTEIDRAPETDNWRKAEDLLSDISSHAVGETVSSGVCVRTFIAYNGAFYGASGSEGQERYYTPAGDFVYYNEQYKTEAFLVKDAPDLVAVVINSGIQEYRKLFDCTFCIGGINYGITFEGLVDVTYACKDMVLETEDFTVYSAVRLQGETSEQKEYIVNVLPILQRELPNFFGDASENYADAWWIARPQPNS